MYIKGVLTYSHKEIAKEYIFKYFIIFDLVAIIPIITSYYSESYFHKILRYLIFTKLRTLG